MDTEAVTVKLWGQVRDERRVTGWLLKGAEAQAAHLLCLSSAGDCSSLGHVDGLLPQEPGSWWGADKPTAVREGGAF